MRAIWLAGDRLRDGRWSSQRCPELRALIMALRGGRAVRFHYFGGNEIGSVRKVTPGLLYMVDGFAGVYLSGFCHARAAERTFLFERMQRIEVEAREG